ncbi:PEP-CTERM sorting domain-containing protein [Massilia sp. UMI-21]|nr:PEP-CTERM sorting domain-containing protein [Massilia sp. UMI-21]
MFSKFSAIACGAFLLVASGSASAGVVWQASSCSSPANTKLARECTSSGAGLAHSVSLTGWSATATGKFGSANLVRYAEGFGILRSGETSSPQHAIDNNGATDAILMQFGTDVALNQLATGWVYNDADVSILRYTGELAPVLGASKINNLLGVAGWELVGNYSSLRTNAPLNFNAEGKTASWWLVSAYNSAYAGTPATWNLGNGNDYFKLKSFQADIFVKEEASSDVPEPASWSLLGIAMLGLAASRRKARAR